MGQILPISYNIKKKTANMSDNEQFIELVEKHTEGKEWIWICKPGENANRGKGIVVLEGLDTVKRFLQGTRVGDRWVVQKYISKPLLVGGQYWFGTPMRKFDIRIFGLA